ncbi:hypothetical protein Ndes2526B_g08218 [Nannochloris sp. 'desiccata']
MVATTEALLDNGASESRISATGFGDCILQIQSPLLAHRVILYHQDDELRYRLFPGGGAEQVIHLEKYDDVPPARNELLLFKNLAVSQIDFKRWLESSFLRFSITRAYFLDGLEATSKNDLLCQLSQMEVPPKEDLFRVVAYPKSLEQYIINQIFGDHLLDKGWDIHPLDYTKTLFAVNCSPTCIRYSFRPAAELFLTPSDGHARVAGQTCKASGKLTEALCVSGFEPRKRGVAIDVGAAPGGWTQVLAETMDTVVAIDPAALHADVLALTNVVHIRQQSQAATEEIIAAVGQDKTIDLLVCDINRHPEEMISILKPLLGMLRSGGMIILTLKYRGKGKEKAGGVEKLKEELGPGFHKVKILWLTANTENERTAVARKK